MIPPLKEFERLPRRSQNEPKERSCKVNLLDRKILNRIQKGLPLVPRPFQSLAEELGIEEDVLLETIRRLRAQGVIRRFGAVFDSRGLGFESTLVALKAPLKQIEEVVELINAYSEVTHHYLRDHEKYNLWFTLIAPSKERIQEILEEIGSKMGLRDMRNLPAKRLFKIRVDFSL